MGIGEEEVEIVEDKSEFAINAETEEKIAELQAVQGALMGAIPALLLFASYLAFGDPTQNIFNPEYTNALTIPVVRGAAILTVITFLGSAIATYRVNREKIATLRNQSKNTEEQ